MDNPLKISAKQAGFLFICTIALFLLACPGVTCGSDSGVQVIYDDQCTTSCVKYILEQSGEGIDGSNCLQLNPDRWHTPVYTLYCGGGKRKDFTPYDVIEFYFKSLESDPGNPTFSLATWNQTSNIVSISDYIDGGLIDHAWRRVRIPLADLKTTAWDLGNVEKLSWNKDNLNRSYYVDDIVLKSITPPVLMTTGEDAPFPESNEVLRLTFSKQYDQESVKTLSNYTLSSDTDPSYEYALNPLDAGIHYRVQGFTESKTPVIGYRVFLKVPAPFQNGHAYVLKVAGIADPSGNLMEPATFSFTYDNTRLPNSNIKINQVGYLPDAPKIGYVGGYLGDLGGGAWAVGEKGAIFAWDDQGGWIEATSPVSSTLRAVAAIRENSAWAVGEKGTILHWDGSGWNPVTSPTSEDLFAVSFGPANIGWAVGAGGTTVRFADGALTHIDTPTKETLRAVWSGPDDTAWAIGDGGTILRWDGSQWIPDGQPVNGNLYAIHGPHQDWLWACGADGTVLLHQYGKWQVFQDTPGTSGTLRSVTSDENGAVWIGGDDGRLWHKPGFGSSPFVTVSSGTTESIHALSRQNGRQFWGVGTKGTLINGTSSGWVSAPNLGSGNLHGVFALAYGPLRLPDPPPRVALKDATTGETALSVPLVLRAGNWHLSGEDLYAFDFSSLNRPGTYEAYVPGIGLSDTIVIGADALNHAAYTTARGLFYQRCGTALTTPYAEDRFTRPMGHEYAPNGRKIDAGFHTSLPGTPLYTNETPGEMIDAHGGWHDAGDYGKYMPTAAAALWFLFTAYDINPAKFRDGTLNIPESGNSIPDLLDEARWEVDWIARMQADDGAVYHKLTAETWFSGMPHEEESPRFLFEKTTHDTALAAAVLACAGRLFRTFDPQVSEDYLNRAERAWRFLKTHSEATPQEGFKNPTGVATGEYNDSDDVDNRLWAAAELYRTTGKKEYREYFENWWANNDHPQGWNHWQHFYKCAYWAYLRANQPGADTNIQEDIRIRIIRNADELVALTEQNPYHNGARLDVLDWIGWGAFTQSSEYAFPLLQAWALSSNREYWDAAALNLDAQLGANPLSFSFITGLGARYPNDPLHKVSTYDGVDEPVPGIPVFGVFAHMSNGQPYYLKVQTDENSYPHSYATTDPYPILRRYVDAHELVPMSEFTIVDMAMAAGVFNLLAGTTGE